MVVKKLCKRYRTESGEKIVFDNFSAEFKDGKVTTVMGSSGIGKTTLLNCIAKLTDYDGEIAGVGSSAYVFQEDRLIPDKTVYDNIDFIMQTEDADERKKRIKNALSVTELLSEAFRYPSELSGGQRKRVSLARAFASGRDLMLLDEPLSSLDMGLKFRIFDVMKKVFKSDSKTVIMVTHDVDEALTLADEIVIIEKGGVAYRKEFSTDLFDRNITDDECNRIRKEIIEILKA